MSWCTVRLADLCSDVFSGGTPQSGNALYYGGDIPWLRTQEVVFNRIRNTEIKISDAGYENSGVKWVREKSVIVAMYGNSAGRSAITEIRLTTNQACCNLVVEPSKADYRFVFYALCMRYEQLKGLARGAAQNNLNASQVKGFEIAIPSQVEEQNRIADVLSAYDDLIENNCRRIKLLEDAAQMLYREWFVYLHFPGREHVKVIDGVPDGWAVKSVADMFSTTSGGTPSRSIPEYFDGDINWVKTQELDEYFVFDTEEHISEAALKNSAAKLYPEGTLLVSIYGGTNIGRTGLLAKAAASNQACVALMPKRHPDDVFFAQKWLQENRSYIIGLGQGAAQTNISQQTLRSQKLLVPSAALLDEFIGSIKPMYRQIATLCQQNTKLRKARDLLLPRLMSGDMMS